MIKIFISEVSLAMSIFFIFSANMYLFTDYSLEKIMVRVSMSIAFSILYFVTKKAKEELI